MTGRRGVAGAQGFDATPDILTYPRAVCPNADECLNWVPVPGRDDGAECGLCGNWLDRHVLAAQLAGRCV